MSSDTNLSFHFSVAATDQCVPLYWHRVPPWCYLVAEHLRSAQVFHLSVHVTLSQELVINRRSWLRVPGTVCFPACDTHDL